MLHAVVGPALGKLRRGDAEVGQREQVDVKEEGRALPGLEIGPEDGLRIHLMNNLPPVSQRQFTS